MPDVDFHKSCPGHQKGDGAPYRRVPSQKHCLWPVALAWSSLDDSALCYVLPVSWMTSCFFHMEQIHYSPAGDAGKLRT